MYGLAWRAFVYTYRVMKMTSIEMKMTSIETQITSSSNERIEQSVGAMKCKQRKDHTDCVLCKENHEDHD
jgi:hypothetical protein